MGFLPFFKKKIQHFALFPKLIREMSLFWNSIFGQLSYKKLKIKNFFFSITRVPCEVLEFLEKIQVELKFLELEYFTWYSSSKLFFFLSPRSL